MKGLKRVTDFKSYAIRNNLKTKEEFCEYLLKDMGFIKLEHCNKRFLVSNDSHLKKSYLDYYKYNYTVPYIIQNYWLETIEPSKIPEIKSGSYINDVFTGVNYISINCGISYLVEILGCDEKQLFCKHYTCLLNKEDMIYESILEGLFGCIKPLDFTICDLFEV